MNNDLFRLLQEVKFYINKINSENYDEQIEETKEQIKKYGTLYNSLNNDMIREDIKIIILNFITLGFYFKRYEYEYNLKKDIVDESLDILKNNINILINDLIKYEKLKISNKNRMEFLIKNRDQIDKFLSLVDNLNEDEKQKIFNYKIGNMYE